MKKNFIEESADITNQIKMLFYGAFVYLNFNKEVFGALIALMVIDSIVGAIKVLRIDDKDFSFRLLVLGWVSKIALLLIPFTIAILGKGLGYDLRILVEISIKLLLVSESISIVSNVIAIKTRKEVTDFDLITKFLKGLRAYFIKISHSFIIQQNENKRDNENTKK